jgi:hypothetical protein
MKICQEITQVFDAGKGTDGQTGMTKVTVAFRNLVNASRDWLRVDAEVILGIY